MRRGGEASASHHEQTTAFGHTYRLRNTLLGFATLSLAMLTLLHTGGAAGLALWLAAGAAIVVAAVIGRMLFYALVVPTTLPGAFFWRNRGFEEHARAIGLAALPQTGVAPHVH
jgi:hypothetical protein